MSQPADVPVEDFSFPHVTSITVKRRTFLSVCTRFVTRNNRVLPAEQIVFCETALVSSFFLDKLFVSSGSKKLEPDSGVKKQQFVFQ